MLQTPTVLGQLNTTTDQYCESLMRKNELLALLAGIPGDPEIVIWNGYAEDWMPIGDITQEILVRESKSHAWGFPNPFADEATCRRWYAKRKKPVVLLHPGLRKKRAYDRIGTIGY